MTQEGGGDVIKTFLKLALDDLDLDLWPWQPRPLSSRLYSSLPPPRFCMHASSISHLSAISGHADRYTRKQSRLQTAVMANTSTVSDKSTLPTHHLSLISPRLSIIPERFGTANT